LSRADLRKAQKINYLLGVITMTVRKIVLGLMLALGGAVVSVPITSLAAVDINVDIAPPAPRVEVVPPPRAGYVWAPGYWEWRGHAHVWVPGYWMRERRGLHWVPAHWDQRGPHWRFVRGHWAP
jgi:hypothetical protein